MTTTRTYRNHLGIEAKGTIVTLIADGPSKEIIIKNPSLAKGSIAVVNRAGCQWGSPIDYWISLHPDEFGELIEERGGCNKDCLFIGFKNSTLRLLGYRYINSNQVHVASGGGGSSLWAVTNLLSMGYKEIYMYGVDYTDRYEIDRKFWKELLAPGCTIKNMGGIFIHHA